MAKLTAEIKLVLAEEAEFRRQLTASLNRSAHEAGRNMGPQMGGALATSTLGINSPFTRLGYEMIQNQGARRAMEMGSLFPQRASMGMAAGGLASGFFSPWIGARILSQSGIFGGGFKEGGMAAGIFGPGGPGAFSAAYVGLTVVTRALKAAFESLIHTVAEVNRISQKSAATGVSTQRLSQLESAFGAIGMGRDVAERFGRQGPAGLSRDEMMQMVNMQDSFNQAMKESANYSETIAKNAKAAQQDFEASARLSREWKATLTGVFSGAQAPLLNAMARGLHFMRTGQLPLDSMQSGVGAHSLGGLVSGSAASASTANSLVSGANYSMGQMFKNTSLERMGFNIGGGMDSPSQLLKKSNMLLAKILDAIGLSGLIPSGYGKVMNYP